jgi:hypothetical protein
VNAADCSSDSNDALALAAPLMSHLPRLSIQCAQAGAVAAHDATVAVDDTASASDGIATGTPDESYSVMRSPTPTPEVRSAAAGMLLCSHVNCDERCEIRCLCQ